MNRYFLKTISFLLIQTFIIQDLCFAAGDLKPLKLDLFSQDKPKINFSLPESIAQIEDSWKAPDNSKTFFLFQDAHTNESGQFNLSKALDIVLDKEGISEVFIEAGFKDSSLPFFKQYGTPKTRAEVASSFVKQGLMHGEEYLYLSKDKDFSLWGVEDFDLYKKSIQTYQEVAKDRAKYQDYLKRINQTLNTLSPRLLHEPLLAFNQKHLAYQRSETTLTDYFKSLLIQAKAQDLSLKSYPHLKLLNTLSYKESKIDFKEASIEQQKAIQSLNTQDQEELKEALTNPSKLGSSPKEDHVKAFFALLKEKITKDTLSQYPNLSKYLDYLKLSSKLKAQGLLKELDSLEEEIFNHLTLTPDEKTFLLCQKNLNYLSKLLDLSLTPQEYQDYKSLSKDFSIQDLTGFLNKKILDLQSYYERALFLEEGYEDIIQRSEDFYTLTYQRDIHFIRESLKRMNTTHSNKAILITGGYHTPNLKALLKTQGISYVSMTPQVLKETNKARYEKLLLNQDFLKLNAAKPITITTGGVNTVAIKFNLPVRETVGARLAELGNKQKVQGLGSRVKGKQKGDSNEISSRRTGGLADSDGVFGTNLQGNGEFSFLRKIWNDLTNPKSLRLDSPEYRRGEGTLSLQRVQTISLQRTWVFIRDQYLNILGQAAGLLTRQGLSRLKRIFLQNHEQTQRADSLLAEKDLVRTLFPSFTPHPSPWTSATPIGARLAGGQVKPPWSWDKRWISEQDGGLPKLSARLNEMLGPTLIPNDLLKLSSELQELFSMLTSLYEVKINFFGGTIEGKAQFLGNEVSLFISYNEEKGIAIAAKNVGSTNRRLEREYTTFEPGEIEAIRGVIEAIKITYEEIFGPSASEQLIDSWLAAAVRHLETAVSYAEKVEATLEDFSPEILPKLAHAINLLKESLQNRKPGPGRTVFSHADYLDLLQPLISEAVGLRIRLENTTPEWMYPSNGDLFRPSNSRLLIEELGEAIDFLQMAQRELITSSGSRLAAEKPVQAPGWRVKELALRRVANGEKDGALLRSGARMASLAKIVGAGDDSGLEEQVHNLKDQVLSDLAVADLDGATPKERLRKWAEFVKGLGESYGYPIKEKSSLSLLEFNKSYFGSLTSALNKLVKLRGRQLNRKNVGLLAFTITVKTVTLFLQLAVPAAGYEFSEKSGNLEKIIILNRIKIYPSIMLTVFGYALFNNWKFSLAHLAASAVFSVLVYLIAAPLFSLSFAIHAKGHEYTHAYQFYLMARIRKLLFSHLTDKDVAAYFPYALLEKPMIGISMNAPTSKQLGVVVEHFFSVIQNNLPDLHESNSQRAVENQGPSMSDPLRAGGARLARENTSSRDGNGMRVIDEVRFMGQANSESMNPESMGDIVLGSSKDFLDLISWYSRLASIEGYSAIRLDVWVSLLKQTSRKSIFQVTLRCKTSGTTPEGHPWEVSPFSKYLVAIVSPDQSAKGTINKYGVVAIKDLREGISNPKFSPLKLEAGSAAIYRKSLLGLAQLRTEDILKTIVDNHSLFHIAPRPDYDDGTTFEVEALGDVVVNGLLLPKVFRVNFGTDSAVVEPVERQFVENLHILDCDAMNLGENVTDPALLREVMKRFRIDGSRLATRQALRRESPEPATLAQGAASGGARLAGVGGKAAGVKGQRSRVKGKQKGDSNEISSRRTGGLADSDGVFRKNLQGNRELPFVGKIWYDLTNPKSLRLDSPEYRRGEGTLSLQRVQTISLQRAWVFIRDQYLNILGQPTGLFSRQGLSRLKRIFIQDHEQTQRLDSLPTEKGLIRAPFPPFTLEPPPWTSAEPTGARLAGEGDPDEEKRVARMVIDAITTSERAMNTLLNARQFKLAEGLLHELMKSDVMDFLPPGSPYMHLGRQRSLPLAMTLWSLAIQAGLRQSKAPGEKAPTDDSSATPNIAGSRLALRRVATNETGGDLLRAGGALTRRAGSQKKFKVSAGQEERLKEQFLDFIQKTVRLKKRGTVREITTWVWDIKKAIIYNYENGEAAKKYLVQRIIDKLYRDQGWSLTAPTLEQSREILEALSRMLGRELMRLNLATKGELKERGLVVEGSRLALRQGSGQALRRESPEPATLAQGAASGGARLAKVGRKKIAQSEPRQGLLRRDVVKAGLWLTALGIMPKGNVWAAGRGAWRGPWKLNNEQDFITFVRAMALFLKENNLPHSKELYSFADALSEQTSIQLALGSDTLFPIKKSLRHSEGESGLTLEINLDEINRRLGEARVGGAGEVVFVILGMIVLGEYAGTKLMLTCGDLVERKNRIEMSLVENYLFLPSKEKYRYYLDHVEDFKEANALRLAFEMWEIRSQTELQRAYHAKTRIFAFRADPTSPIQGVSASPIPNYRVDEDQQIREMIIAHYLLALSWNDSRRRFLLDYVEFPLARAGVTQDTFDNSDFESIFRELVPRVKEILAEIESRVDLHAPILQKAGRDSDKQEPSDHPGASPVLENPVGVVRDVNGSRLSQFGVEQISSRGSLPPSTFRLQPINGSRLALQPGSGQALRRESPEPATLAQGAASGGARLAGSSSDPVTPRGSRLADQASPVWPIGTYLNRIHDDLGKTNERWVVTRMALRAYRGFRELFEAILAQEEPFFILDNYFYYWASLFFGYGKNNKVMEALQAAFVRPDSSWKEILDKKPFMALWWAAVLVDVDLMTRLSSGQENSAEFFLRTQLGKASEDARTVFSQEKEQDKNIKTGLQFVFRAVEYLILGGEYDKAKRFLRALREMVRSEKILQPESVAKVEAEIMRLETKLSARRSGSRLAVERPVQAPGRRRNGARLSYTLDLSPSTPATESPTDRARLAMSEEDRKKQEELASKVRGLLSRISQEPDNLAPIHALSHLISKSMNRFSRRNLIQEILECLITKVIATSRDDIPRAAAVNTLSAAKKKRLWLALEDWPSSRTFIKRMISVLTTEISLGRSRGINSWGALSAILESLSDQFFVQENEFFLAILEDLNKNRESTFHHIRYWSAVSAEAISHRLPEATSKPAGSRLAVVDDSVIEAQAPGSRAKGRKSNLLPEVARGIMGLDDSFNRNQSLLDPALAEALFVPRGLLTTEGVMEQRLTDNDKIVVDFLVKVQEATGVIKGHISLGGQQFYLVLDKNTLTISEIIGGEMQGSVVIEDFKGYLVGDKIFLSRKELLKATSKEFSTLSELRLKRAVETEYATQQAGQMIGMPGVSDASQASALHLFLGDNKQALSAGALFYMRSHAVGGKSATVVLHGLQAKTLYEKAMAFAREHHLDASFITLGQGNSPIPDLKDQVALFFDLEDAASTEWTGKRVVSDSAEGILNLDANLQYALMVGKTTLELGSDAFNSLAAWHANLLGIKPHELDKEELLAVLTGAIRIPDILRRYALRPLSTDLMNKARFLEMMEKQYTQAA